MNATRHALVVNTLPYTEYARKISKPNKSIVSQIVINKLPMPDNTTPWEKIIEYRNDPDTHKKLTALRRWINRTTTQNLAPLEIEEEIEFLINDFQDHMKIHKMKANAETLEVIIKTPFEIIENLLKFNFSKISDPLIAIKKMRINLMEAELNAPGKEMAYIIKTREAF